MSTEVRSSPSVARLQTQLLFVLMATTCAVFAGVWGHQFVHFDDNINIYANPNLTGFSWGSLKWMFTDTEYVRRYMPIGWASYAVDRHFFGLSPRAYHVGNLLLHLVNVLLLFFLLKSLLVLARRVSNPSDTAPIWCAGAGALFWAVNPLRAENVAWASSRIYCVAFLFTILWLLAWLHSQSSATPSHLRKWFYWLSVVAYAASLLTYPLAIFTPIALFVLEVYPLRRIEPRVSGWWKANAAFWRDKLPFLLLAAGGLALTLWARGAISGYNQPVTQERFNVVSRSMQALYVWAYYVWKPWVPLNLSPTYTTLHSFNPVSFPFLLSAFSIIAVSGVVIILRKRWPVILALWLCHLAWLVPVLGITEYNPSPSDRYSYLHGILWSVAIASILYALSVRGKWGHVGVCIVAATSLIFALLTSRQVTVWRNTFSLHRHIIAQLKGHPYRARFDEVLGLHYLRAGLTNEAVTSFQSAVFYETRRRDRAVVDEGVLSRAHCKLGDIIADQDRAEEALAHYRAALEADPRMIPARISMGTTLASLDRPEEAVHCFEEVLQLNPDSGPAHHNLAVTLKKMGKEDEARSHFEEARRLFAKNN